MTKFEFKMTGFVPKLHEDGTISYEWFCGTHKDYDKEIKKALKVKDLAKYKHR